MRLWRISNFADLTGKGGLLVAGRWHSRGRPIVYMADHTAATLIEMLVHFDIRLSDVPATYQLLAIDVPDDVRFAGVEMDDLPADWLTDLNATRAIGDGWLAGHTTALLRVPSAIVPAAFNWLLNPNHPDAARIKIAEIIRAPFDPRLLRQPKSAEKRRGRAPGRRGRGRSPRPSGGPGRRRSRR